ncbi:MAG: hypothetical protein ACBR12_10615 [Microcoleus sp.]
MKTGSNAVRNCVANNGFDRLIGILKRLCLLSQCDRNWGIESFE